MSIETMNSTTAVPLGLSPVLIALRTCFVAIIAVLIICGNILVVAVTRRVTNLADSTKVLMTSLAVYDLLVGVSAVLISAIASALDRWPFGEAGCYFYAIVMTVAVSMSTLSVTCLNIERYIAVTRPFKFPLWCTRRRAITLVVVASIACLSCAPLPKILLATSPYYYEGSLLCFYSNTSIYLNIFFLLSCNVFPTLLMSCIYYHLVKISRDHEQRLNRNGNNEANNNRDNKALKTFLVVTLTFVGCFFPFTLVRVGESLTGELSPNWLQFLSAWLGTSNSMFNVWIYCLFNSSFRERAKTIISERFPCCNRSVAPAVA
ncbi:beta-1 adrenergic receptor-like [Asterias amurensis]|uniref:beta-1 adrenergic receptor-like n=1 Tax=Asterias amurensis TaxID=7602 RepID=UPI003AB67001